MEIRTAIGLVHAFAEKHDIASHGLRSTPRGGSVPRRACHVTEPPYKHQRNPSHDQLSERDASDLRPLH